jgi:PadR family transcriptional regulator, regulatory protein PadR
MLQSLMPDDIKLSHSAALILRTIECGYCYGFDVMEVTGLPSGTVYPALRRLERDNLITARWEDEALAFAEQRPARRYYRITRTGKQALQRMMEKYPLLQKLTPAQKQ